VTKDTIMQKGGFLANVATIMHKECLFTSIMQI